MSQAQITLSGQSYLNYVNALRSPITRSHYERALKRYMKFCNIDNPDQLLNRDPKTIQASIIDWIIFLRNPPNSLSHSSLTFFRSAVITFYQMNDIILNSKRIGRYQGEKQRQFTDRTYTRQEIHKLVDMSDERMKVIILLLASCGLRPGAIPSLVLRNLQYLEDYKLHKIIVYEGHEKQYFTFCTPECSKAIHNYLDYRQRSGERLTDNSPLIRQQFDRNDILQVKNPKPLKLRGINQLLDILLYKSGLHELVHRTEGRKDKRKEIARANGFSKFTITNMAEAGVDFEIRESLVGHSLGLSAHYLRHSAQTVILEWLKCVDFLTINEENRLKRKIEMLEVEKTKIDQLADTIEMVKQKLNIEW